MYFVGLLLCLCLSEFEECDRMSYMPFPVYKWLPALRAGLFSPPLVCTEVVKPSLILTETFPNMQQQA